MAELSKNYGFSDNTLMAVINATETALGKMNYLNSEVQSMSAVLPVVNNSTSGQRLAGRIGDWTYEFGQVVGALQVLHDKANDLLKTNRNVVIDTNQSS